MTGDVRLFTTRDVLPTGQTGFDLDRRDRRNVRLVYRSARTVSGCSRDEAIRLLATLCELLDRSPYGRFADVELDEDPELDRRQYEHDRAVLDDDRLSIGEAMFGAQG